MNPIDPATQKRTDARYPAVMEMAIEQMEMNCGPVAAPGCHEGVLKVGVCLGLLVWYYTQWRGTARLITDSEGLPDEDKVNALGKRLHSAISDEYNKFIRESN